MQIPTINGTRQLDSLPDKCPFCHNSITPNVIFGYIHGSSLEALLSCPDKKCNKAFIAYYSFIPTSASSRYVGQTSQGTLIGRDFSEKLMQLSPSFVTIYNQAFAAEQQNLSEICGIGYRKALEFLIKDYAIQNNPSHHDKIEKDSLSAVIDKYVNDLRIKSVSKRAVWLGNDETHYLRKWEGRNLDDLKKLIDLTIHWIEMEMLTSSFEKEMPE